MIPLELDAVLFFAAGGIAGGAVVGIPLYYFLSRKVKDKIKNGLDYKIKNGLDYNTLKTLVILHEKEIELLLEKVTEMDRTLKVLRSKVG